MTKYLVKIYTPQELNHSSYVQTGLFELEAEGFIQTKVILSLNERRGLVKLTNGQTNETGQPHPKTTFYQLIDTHTGKKINFATDLYDAAFSFSKYALVNSDYIFKRNYDSVFINQLPIEEKQKLKPFGLTFIVRSKHQKALYKFYSGLFFINLLLSIKLDRRITKRISNCINEQISHLRFFIKSPIIDSFETYTPFTKKTHQKIFYQKRCFPNESGIDVREIHEQRFRIVCNLRHEFNDIFIGGIIPSPIAIQKYSEALVDLPLDPVAFLKTVKETDLVIYTRGLTNSPAWSLAEYLSQGKVIIAERVTAELPVPLTHRKEVLFFDNESEIPALIREAMNDPELFEQLSKNARAYFEKYVHPKQNMKRILQFLMKQLEHE